MPFPFDACSRGGRLQTSPAVAVASAASPLVVAGWRRVGVVPEDRGLPRGSRFSGASSSRARCSARIRTRPESSKSTSGWPPTSLNPTTVPAAPPSHVDRVGTRRDPIADAPVAGCCCVALVCRLPAHAATSFSPCREHPSPLARPAAPAPDVLRTPGAVRSGFVPGGAGRTVGPGCRRPRPGSRFSAETP